MCLGNRAQWIDDAGVLLVVSVVAVMVGAPIVVGVACHIALRWPAIGGALALALFAYASHRSDLELELGGVPLPFVGKLLAGAIAIAGGFVAMAAIGGRVYERHCCDHDLPVARARRRS